MTTGLHGDYIWWWPGPSSGSTQSPMVPLRSTGRERLARPGPRERLGCCRIVLRSGCKDSGVGGQLMINSAALIPMGAACIDGSSSPAHWPIPSGYSNHAPTNPAAPPDPHTCQQSICIHSAQPTAELLHGMPQRLMSAYLGPRLGGRPRPAIVARVITPAQPANMQRQFRECTAAWWNSCSRPWEQCTAMKICGRRPDRSAGLARRGPGLLAAFRW